MVNSRGSLSATWRAKLLGLVLLLSACAGGEPPPPPAFQTLSQDMFQAVLSDVQRYFIEDEDLSTLTLVALEGITDVDPSLSMDQAGSVLSVLSNGTTVAEREWPADGEVSDYATVAGELLYLSYESSNLMQESGEEAIFESIFTAMLGQLDRYSRYAGNDKAQENRGSREGFGSIGISLGEHPNGALVLSVDQGKPAQAAGIHGGDIIVSIDGRPLAGMSLRRILLILRGPVNKPVGLVVRRPGLAEPMIATVGRTRIVPNTVFLRSLGRIAILKISNFNDTTPKRVAEAFSEAMAVSGSELAGIVLDLRGNLGGLLDKAIDVADLFLHDGIISTTDGRHPRSFQKFEAVRGDITAGIPIVVMIDGASASSAEVLAAALQDRGRAVLVGATSFGKGSVQTVRKLPNGGELILTWARLQAPSGYILQDGGVMPTICTQGSIDAPLLLRHTIIDDPATTIHNLALRRRISANDVLARNSLAQLCPWRLGEGAGIAEDVAERLLLNPELYDSAIALALPQES